MEMPIRTKFKITIAIEFWGTGGSAGIKGLEIIGSLFTLTTGW